MKYFIMYEAVGFLWIETMSFICTMRLIKEFGVDTAIKIAKEETQSARNNKHWFLGCVWGLLIWPIRISQRCMEGIKLK